MKADYQLKHRMAGSLGSAWTQQLDKDSLRGVTAVTKEAGSYGPFKDIDLSAATALPGRVSVTSVNSKILFSDGDFAVVGRHQNDYLHYSVTLSDDSKVYVGYRGYSPSSSQNPVPTILARVTQDFLSRAAQGSVTLSEGNDWYLVPTSVDIQPIVLQGKDGRRLVSGVDFESFTGYIAMTTSPADAFDVGQIKVVVGKRVSRNANAYVIGCEKDILRTNFISAYNKQSQSLEAFKRAAAEFAGMYVFSGPDIVIDKWVASDSYVTYVMAAAGLVEVRYAHEELNRGDVVDKGRVLSNTFRVAHTNHDVDAEMKKQLTGDWETALSLDGVLPVKGLTWTPGEDVRLEYTETDPVSGIPHMVPLFGGPTTELGKLWRLLSTHEKSTGNFLYSALGLTSTEPTSVDFWDLLESYYGSSLVLVLCRAHNPVIDSRLHRFVYGHHPYASVVLTGLQSNFPDCGVAKDLDGYPVVNDRGQYVESTLAGESVEELHNDLFEWVHYDVETPLYLDYGDCPDAFTGSYYDDSSGLYFNDGESVAFDF